MRWLADECVAAVLVKRLRETGHDVIYVLDSSSGAANSQIIRDAYDENRLLLTEDRDFGELIFREMVQTPGVVHMRIPAEQRLLKWPQLRLVIEQCGIDLFQRYTVIEPNRFRFRTVTNRAR